jgi:hypothetical protein
MPFLPPGFEFLHPVKRQMSRQDGKQGSDRQLALLDPEGQLRLQPDLFSVDAASGVAGQNHGISRSDRGELEDRGE